jgi:hypothetical protein
MDNAVKVFTFDTRGFKDNASVIQKAVDDYINDSESLPDPTWVITNISQSVTSDTLTLIIVLGPPATIQS